SIMELAVSAGTWSLPHLLVTNHYWLARSVAFPQAHVCCSWRSEFVSEVDFALLTSLRAMAVWVA
ncbi:MAG: hypothetical protein ACKPKO_63585, partial [Candidatus Fonsibacter sp.]